LSQYEVNRVPTSVVSWAEDAGLLLCRNSDGTWLYHTQDHYYVAINEPGEKGRWIPHSPAFTYGYGWDTFDEALKNPPPYPPGFTPKTPTAFTAVKDSGKRESFTTGSRRDTREGKGRFDLFSPLAMFRLARHYENGAVKYGDRNWEKGQPQSRFMDSAIRHLFKYLGGARDEDHLSAAAWNVMAMIHQEEQFVQERLDPSLNDLPTDQGVSLRPDVGLPGREPSVVPKDDKDLAGDVTDR
jgi:hypothetical protein